MERNFEDGELSPSFYASIAPPFIDEEEAGLTIQLQAMSSTQDLNSDTSASNNKTPTPELNFDDGPNNPVELKLGRHTVTRPHSLPSRIQNPRKDLPKNNDGYQEWLYRHGLQTQATPTFATLSQTDRSHRTDGEPRSLQGEVTTPQRNSIDNHGPENSRLHDGPGNRRPTHGHYRSDRYRPDTYKPSLTFARSYRYEGRGDGEVTRMGAGESYRPAARARSPVRDSSRRRYDRDRSPRRDRSRARTPPRARSRGRTPSDSYHPRSPRRRSRTPLSYRARDRTPPRDIPNWRSRDRARTPPRERARTPPRERARTPPRERARTPPRERARSPPRGTRSPPRRFSPRRDDDRRDRARSPRRDETAPRDTRRTRSRSPFDNRPPPRVRSPLPGRRTPPTGPRGDPKARSRSPRRDNVTRGPTSITWRRRSPSPPAAADKSSGRASGDTSRRNSPPIPQSRLPPTQSTPREPVPRTRDPSPISHRDSARSTPRERSPPRALPAQDRSSSTRSPPRGPASLRAPTGPSVVRNFTTPVVPTASASASSQSRPENAAAAAPVVPPSGPRGYNAPSRGAFAPRGGRGGSFASAPTERRDSTGSWGAAPSRAAPIVSPTLPSPASASNGIPTGPRAASTPSADWSNKSWPGGPSRSASQASISTPRTQSFATSSGPAQPRVHPALANLPLIIPGGKIDPTASGYSKELEERLKKREEEIEKMREDLQMKEEKVRRSLKTWEKLDREAKGSGLRSELSERHMRVLAGEGVGGAAF